MYIIELTFFISLIWLTDSQMLYVSSFVAVPSAVNFCLGSVIKDSHVERLA
jgi:hypothetical protein